MDDLLAHFTAAARPGRDEERCSCCRATGEHEDRSECDRCDGSGRMHRGDDAALPWCPGREQDQPAPAKRRHWREGARQDRMSVADLLDLHSDEALRRERNLTGDRYLGHGDSTRVRTLYDRKAAEMAGNPAWHELDEPIRSGTIDPVLLEKASSGHTVVSEGGHRIVRAHQLGVSHLPVSWDPGSQAHRYDWDEPEPMQHEAAGPEEYGIGHRPMESGAPLHDLTGEAPGADFDTTAYQPPDYLTHPQYNSDTGSGNDPADAEALAQMRRVQGKPDAPVHIYRASHHSAPHEINTGDWVTLSKRYAATHAYNESGNDEPENQWVVHHAQVPTRHVRDSGMGGYREQGYWGPPITCCGHEKTAAQDEDEEEIEQGHLSRPEHFARLTFTDYPGRDIGYVAQALRHREPKYMGQLERHIRRHGVQQPVEIAHHDEDAWEVGQGHHRLAAAWQLGKPVPYVRTQEHGDYYPPEEYREQNTAWRERRKRIPAEYDAYMRRGEADDPFHGKWAARREAVLPMPTYGPEPKYEYAPRDWPPEKRDEHNEAMFEQSRQWKAHIKRGLSLGHLTAEQAKGHGYYFGGHETDSHNDPKWAPLPHDLYHVTTDEPSVRQHGLKTRQELDQLRGGHGLGGGEDDTISFAADKGVGHNILRALHEFHGVANGTHTPAQMWEDAKVGRGADRPFHTDIARSWDSGWKEGDPHPDGLRRALEGTRRWYTGGSDQETIDKAAPGARPAKDDEGWMSGHTPPRRMHAYWEKDMDPDERRENAVDFYKKFAMHRQYAGGPEDPMFFATDTKAFAAKDPKHFALLHVHPRPGAQGYPVSALSEWRTGTGDAVGVHHAEHLEPQQHEGARHQAGDVGDYGMEMRPDEEGDPLHAMGSVDWPKDIYDRLSEYDDSGGEYGYAHESKIRRARGNPEKRVRIYRAAPALNPESRNAKKGEFNHGDWVTLNKPYADADARSVNETSERNFKGANDPGRSHVWSTWVPAKHVRSAGNSLMEWGYWGDRKEVEHSSAECSHRNPFIKRERQAPRRRFEDTDFAGKGHYGAAPRTWFAAGPALSLTAADLFHGSDREEPFSRFDFHQRSLKSEDEEESPLYKQEGEGQTTRWWNSRLGSHFTSEHGVASEIAQRMGGHGNVYHVELRQQNPKHYASEHDLAEEGVDWARKNGYKGLRNLGFDTEQGWHHADALQNHPQAQQIAEGFRAHLQRRGYDGITYGNEYEGTKGHLSAIAFHPGQVKITGTHGGYEPCRYDEDTSHEAARRRPLRPDQEECWKCGVRDSKEKFTKAGPYAPVMGLAMECKDADACRARREASHTAVRREDSSRFPMTIYRGEGSHDRPSHYPKDSGEAGGWWTSNLAAAHRYAAGERGSVYQLDVERHEVEPRGLPGYYFVGDPAVRARRSPVADYGEEGQHTAAWQREAAVFTPTERIFGPTFGLDHRLFTADEQLKPEVRQVLLGRLQAVLEPLLGPAWHIVTRVYLAGSQASRWTSEQLEGNGDLDVLIGVAYSYARQEAPALAALTDVGIDKHLNAVLQQRFNAPGWHPPFDPDGTYDLTGYVNHNALDITAIKPYAAYDLTSDSWAVKPPDLPDWSPESFPQGPAVFQEARGLISQVRAILRLPEPFRAQEAARIWAYIHEGRTRAFSIEGEGWVDTPNVLEKALDQASGKLVEKLKHAVYGPPSGPMALGHGMTTADLGSAHA